MPILLKQILRFIFKSLLVPFISKNLDKWTTILNKKLLTFMEKDDEKKTHDS